MMSGFRFSRDLESEADAYGLMLMARAGYPPRAAAEIDTADALDGRSPPPEVEGRDEFAAVILNDPGASRYLLENLARDGWTALLRFNEGEVLRLRNANRDHLKAAAAEAMHRYLALKPDAPDAPMIRFTMAHPVSATSAEFPTTRWEEVWTWNGPQLDRMALISELPDDEAITSRNTTADQQVPVFRADMTAQDLASMLEVSYRVRGVTMFNFDSVEPVDFLGGRVVRLRYNYVSGIGINKRGVCVMRVVDRKLYAMKLESLADRAFDAVAPEFDHLVAEARLGM